MRGLVIVKNWIHWKIEDDTISMYILAIMCVGDSRWVWHVYVWSILCVANSVCGQFCVWPIPCVSNHGQFCVGHVLICVANSPAILHGAATGVTATTTEWLLVMCQM